VIEFGAEAGKKLMEIESNTTVLTQWQGLQAMTGRVNSKAYFWWIESVLASHGSYL
jgi:hypothetical protein